MTSVLVLPTNIHTTMNIKLITRQYTIFLFGLFVTAFGVAFITKALLGTSPISSIPYSLSLIYPKLSMGNWTIVFSILLIIFQIVLQGKSSNKLELFLQLIITFAFGYLIDLSMYCLRAFNPDIYVIQLISLVSGCAIIALGAYMQVIADVVMLPGDALVRALSKLLKREYGEIRVISDVTMSVIAGILCLAFLHKLSGVREGTIIAAFITGIIVKVYINKLKPLTNWLLPEKTVQTQPSTPISEDNFVLTISREYGSGGLMIGKLVAKILRIPYYDYELIRLAAQQSGYAEEFIREHEQMIDRPFLHELYARYTSAVNEDDNPVIEQIYHIEEQVIKELAARHSCVIVGRLANYILRDHKNGLHVFVNADIMTKIKAICKKDNLPPEFAQRKIARIDIERANHCRYFTHRQWGRSNYYDLVLNSSRYGIKGSARIIVQAVKQALK